MKELRLENLTKAAGVAFAEEVGQLRPFGCGKTRPFGKNRCRIPGEGKGEN